MADPEPRSQRPVRLLRRLIDSVAAAGGNVEVLGLGRPDRRAPTARAPSTSWWLPDDNPHSRWGSLASTLPNIAYRCRTAGMRRMLQQAAAPRRLGRHRVRRHIRRLGAAGRARALCRPPRPPAPRSTCRTTTKAACAARSPRSQPLFLKRQAVRLDALKVSRLERELVDAVDFVTAITHEDMALYRAGAQASKPMDVLTPGYCGRRVDERRISPALPRRAVIVGSFDWIAKRMNLAEFVDVADPLFAEAGAELQAVGSGDEGLPAAAAPAGTSPPTSPGRCATSSPILDQARDRHRARALRRRLQAQGAGVRLQPRAGVRARGLLRRRAVAPQRQRHALCRPCGPGARCARGDRRRRAPEPACRSGHGPPAPAASTGRAEAVRSSRRSPAHDRRRHLAACSASARRDGSISSTPVLVVIFLLGLYLGVSLAVSRRRCR